MNLENNSSEMATVVETFIQQETAELIYDNEQLEKWNSLVTELGLTGQTTIVKPEKSPIPFLHMKESIVNIFECLCPIKVEVEKFNVTPIPLEIMEMIALSKREGYFDKIEIWYDEKTPDPVCVGTLYTNWTVTYPDKNIPSESGLTKQEAEGKAKGLGGTVDKYSWYREQYLLGKWGDVKKSFDELRKLATERFLGSQTILAKQKIRDAQRELEDLETNAYNKFN